MNLYAFTDVSPAVQIHAIAAGCALLTGLSLFVLPRGRLGHRTLGIIMAIGLLVAAISACFIFQLNNGWPSLLHIFIPITFMGLFGVGMGFARRNWKQHRNAGRRLVLGALVLPGLIAFIPGRLLYIVAFG